MAAMELELEASTVEKARALLQGALAGNKSEEALKICEDFELEHCGTGDLAVALPFYRIQFITYLMHDLVNARWLWERVPEAVRSDEDMCKIWAVAKLLWNSDMAAAYSLLTSPGWKDSQVAAMASQLVDNIRKDKVALVAKSHSTISITSCSHLLGLGPEQTVSQCKSLGWGIEGDFIKPLPMPASVSTVLNADQLQALTDYVCSLDTK